MSAVGRLIVVGCGIQMARHISRRALSEIEAADAVFALADPLALRSLRDLRPDLINLAGCYADTKDRRQSYCEMETAIMQPVRAGLRVCAVFYGHPGVYAQVSHRVIEATRQAGGVARMEPGISAEACLYADLGIDPGASGVHSFEATRFLVYEHSIDPSALLLLWQVALTGNLECTGFEPDPVRLALLVDKLRRWYHSDTEIILYEAAQLPIEAVRAENMPLRDLPQARFREHTTLVIPPTAAPRHDRIFWPRAARLAGLS
ncbi:MAG: hypothetical protein HND55_02195 [Pseudomonadota bacterium]|nr:MAG: hypothetical protein HND55_02195 [Pseudomonadota bacterium]